MVRELRIGNVGGTEKGWAIINSNGPHGDEIIAGYLSEADAVVCFNALIQPQHNARRFREAIEIAKVAVMDAQQISDGHAVEFLEDAFHGLDHAWRVASMVERGEHNG